MINEPVSVVLLLSQIEGGQESLENAQRDLSAVRAITDVLTLAGNGSPSRIRRIGELLGGHLGYVEHELKEIERLLVERTVEALHDSAAELPKSRIEREAN